VPPSATDAAWLSLGPASRALGVGPDTLRRWADEGRVRSFTTPGGHRRFDRRDVQRILATRGFERRPLAAMGATPKRLAQVYARSYRIAGDAEPRMPDLDAGDREGFRLDGRRLLEALLGYLDAGPAERPAWEADARAAARSTGERLAAARTPVVDAVATFIAARRPFLTELAALGRRRALDGAALTALYDDAAALLDRLLLEFVAAVAAEPPAPETR
jgi:excisionase family DNA binding protein